MYSRSILLLAICIIAANACLSHADDLRTEATQALQQASNFFANQVASHGGYLWRYSADLKLREGEEVVGPDTVWIEPPGTPSIGIAFLRAYQATEDRQYLTRAREVAQCLIEGQLASGGWDNLIEFAPAQRKRYAYRVDGPASKKARNTTTFDDNKTQEVLRFLMRLDQQLEFNDKQLHEAVMYALDKVLEAQYPNGAWPQRFDGSHNTEGHSVTKANYPETWPRTFPNVKYQGFYTFNDNSIADVIHVMFEAADVYGDRRYADAALKGGDFILLAQMPEPQPAWAQQYNLKMQPAWARKFEPASVTGGESQGILQTLIDIYILSGEKKYLEPVPKAIKYLMASQRKDGKMARFYELKTNKPIYFTKDYQLTYSDADMPTHYGFVVGNKLAEIKKRYETVSRSSEAEREKSRRYLLDHVVPARTGKPSTSLAKATQQVIDAMDDQGRWLESGELKGGQSADGQIINCKTFVRNMETLSRYLAIRP